MRFSVQLSKFLCVALISLGCTIAFAQKGKKGGKGGGGGQSSDPTYTILKLDDAGGTLTLSSFEGIVDLNDLGGVAGNVANSDGFSLPAYWQSDGNTTQITVMDSAGGVAFGCNNFDEVVGGGAGYPSYWASPSSEAVFLDSAVGAAYGINDAGIACGYSLSADSSSNLPTLWYVASPDLGRCVLPVLPEFPQGVVTRISEMDSEGFFFALGYLGVSRASRELYARWSIQFDTSGNLVADAPVVFDLPSTSRIGVLGLNDIGETCGTFYDETLIYEKKDWLPVGNLPMHWSASGAPTTLATLPSTVLSPNIAKVAFDINNSGTLVGECYAYQSSKKQRSGMFATVWSGFEETPVAVENVASSSPFDYLTKAVAINESGVIVGEGGINSARLGFLAIPNQ